MRKIECMYSDNSGEIASACKRLGVPHEKSAPYVPEANGMIERANQAILVQTPVVLVQAGLPPCFWSHVAPTVCLLLNTDKSISTGAWAKTHGSDFTGKRMPFGAKVSHLPLLRPLPDKWSPPTRIGVFAGCDITPGYGFRGHYLVWDLEDVAQIDLSANAEGSTMHIVNP